MTLSSGQFREYEAKYISENDSHIYVYVFTSGKAVYVPKTQEYKKMWDKPDIKPGDMILIKVPEQFSHNNDLFGLSKVYGTGGRKDP